MNMGEDTELEDLFTDHVKYTPSSQSKRKRIKLDNRCNNNKDNNSETVSKWNYNGDSSIVEPEVLVDLGVGMLDDDTSCDSTKRTQSQPFSNSPSSMSSNKRHLAAESSRLMDNKENSYRASNVDQDDDLERLHKDPCARQEDSSSSLDNESGYVTRVETETSVEKQSSNLSTNSSWEEMNQFYLYRRKRRPSLGGEDKFSTLSDEIILMILKWLPKKCLVRSMLVCKRWHQIARDEALWARLDLGNKVLAPGTLGHILPRGVQIMRLAQAEMPGPIINPTSEIMNDTYRCKLQYLDLSMAVIDPDSLALLLSKCRLLKKLSLEKCSLNNDCCKAISNNPDLTVLNLTMCDGIKPNGCKYLMELKKLKELNMSWSSLGIKSVTEICLSLPSTVTRLNLAGCRKTMTDIDVSYLLKSCPDLKELDLSDCSLLTAESINYFTMFKKLEHLSLSRCYGIPHASSYMKLTHMPSLLYLDIFGIMTDVALKTFSANCNNTQINKYFYSSIARPTVGIRRTSIWELRVRDYN